MRAWAGVAFILAVFATINLSLATAGTAGALLAGLLPGSRTRPWQPTTWLLGAGVGVAFGWCGAVLIFGSAAIFDRQLGGFPIAGICLGQAATAGLAVGVTVRLRRS